MRAQPLRLAVLVSGNGSNLQTLIDAIDSQKIDAHIVLVLSSDAGAPALYRAARRGIPAIAMEYKPDLKSSPSGDTRAARRTARAAYDAAIAEAVLAASPDYVLLLGWMRILGEEFIRCFPGKIVNLHPALPGIFPGTHAIERAWDARARGEIEYTGIMVHYVPDTRVDAGPVILSRRVDFIPGESLERFEARMHENEHELIVAAVAQLTAEKGD
jgi:formyltetrahydrofolate-dependent phosphoribosylglycinamide formyltransferase